VFQIVQQNAAKKGARDSASEQQRAVDRHRRHRGPAGGAPVDAASSDIGKQLQHPVSFSTLQ